MSKQQFYPIGTPGFPWSKDDKSQWLKRVNQKPQRSYRDDVLSRLDFWQNTFDVKQYGALSQDPQRYPLYCVKTKEDFNSNNKPCILITGGTHGYETSGVHGAMLFIEKYMQHYSQYFHIAVLPCVSPWSYECVQRWNSQCLDPNRQYLQDSPCEESRLVVEWLLKQSQLSNNNTNNWIMHLDLHETTDSDLHEFIPAEAARDGVMLEDEEEVVIPDGFYLIGNEHAPYPEWHKAMMDAVRNVGVHIVADQEIFGKAVLQEGVIASEPKGKGKGVLLLLLNSNTNNGHYNTPHVSTTEVYPDSKTHPLTSQQCAEAQVACIVGGIDYLLSSSSKTTK
mmetsp:Transcript_12061/g.18598  ORF Transcript_12061/g.18598 Transcript_12061/m.18598 type:complete len:337 (-) Transcript_12061:53-1063(-)|eukprot:CAMPEP_0194206090 /NCGR_PEP_ID=MMETSP0156-20130528/5212_1 /TAXON_ID=33649 /ORGANISM="Thalassionema nitzschioides, Strain L26-B" /LENGTH=336 /DNA_ID=CAMNT_0038932519 /DNA_START=143 /DNA_END=1153 /DNA_ORIENTATION=-